ncbi:ISL3 family transposase [Azospirillum brasilense]|nr:ISL3 family transposase [Azospirillum brasilense]
MFVRAQRRSAPCPRCHAPSSRVHSRYERRLADLPWQGRPVILRLQARRFLCREADCPKHTFAERPPGIVQPSARRSERLVDIQRHIALALGGEAGGRLVERLAMPVSPDTLLRLATTAPRIDAPAPRVLGVDEWAWRKGHRYGTILVDLERGNVVDLLPDRDASSFAAWLRAHPGVEVIVRDRADVYADGARQGAASAVHVTDRWHLLRNLGDAVRAAVGAHHAAVRRAATACASAGAAPVALTPTKPSARDVRKAATHAPRHARYAEARRLADAGATVSAIARSCALDRKTVRAWLRDGGPGTWAHPSRSGGILAPYLEHLEHRWAEGQRNATALWREIGGRGFAGGRSTVRAWATSRRRTSSDTLDAEPSKADTWKPPSIRGVARLLQADRKDLAEADRVFVDTLLGDIPALSDVHNLAHRFAALVRKQGIGTLDDWMAATAGTSLEGFASGLRKDLAAVRAALETPWSTGPVEGRINRLKTVKRTMYGRAGFELLRSRTLHAA